MDTSCYGECCLDYVKSSLLPSLQWTIAKRSSHGDWLLLTFLLDNMNVLVRSEFIKELGQLKHYDEDAH